MTYRTWIGAVCAALTFMLAGCLEYEETITIEHNGSGTIDVSARIPQSLRVNPEMMGPYAPLIDSEEDARAYLESRGMELVSWTPTERDDSLFLTAEIRFKSIGACSESSGLDTFSWSSESDGTLRLGRTLATKKPVFKLSSSDRKAREELQLVFAMNLPSNVALAALRHRPYTSVEGNTARWEISGNDYSTDFTSAMSLFATGKRAIMKQKGWVFTAIWWALVVLMVFGGYSCRLFGSLGTFFAIVIANTVALNLFEPLAGLLGNSISDLDPLADALCYIVVFFGVYIGIQMAMLARFREWLSFHTNFDRVLSIGVGVLNGIMIAGVISTLYFLLPLTDDWIGGRLNAEDPAPHSVRIFRHCANRFDGSNRFDPIGQFPHKYSE